MSEDPEYPPAPEPSTESFAEPQAGPQVVSTDATAITPSNALEGSWETAGRTPASAATFGLLGVGVVYSNALSFLVIFGALFSAAADKFASHSDNLFDDPGKFLHPTRFAVFFAQFAFMLLPTVWLIRHWHTHRVLEYIRFRKTHTLDIATAVACTAIFFPLNVGIGAFFLHLLHVPDFLMKINSGFLTAHSPGEFAWLVLVVAVTPAICEETLFRGYAQRTFERSIGWKSILLTGFIFGLYHMQPLGLFTLSTLGFMFGYFYYRSGSMLPNMAAHFTNNFLALLASWRGLPDFSKTATTLILISSVLALICILTAYQIASSRSRVATFES